MTPQDMSALHHRAFAPDRGWSPTEFAQLLCTPHVAAHVAPRGFALTRTIAGESELLTLAVAPEHQRRGIARSLVQDWLNSITGHAHSAFLEVASDNHAAQSLYAGFRFAQIACRQGYYLRKDAPSVDALILRRDLTLGNRPESTQPRPESG